MESIMEQIAPRALAIVGFFVGVAAVSGFIGIRQAREFRRVTHDDSFIAKVLSFDLKNYDDKHA